MQVKLKNLDWDSMAFVVRNFEPKKLSMTEIFNLEKVIEEIDRALRGYLEERAAYAIKGEKLLQKRREEVKEMQKKNSDGKTEMTIMSPDVQKKIEEANSEMEKEINAPMQKIGDKLLLLDLSDDIFDSLKSAFQKSARFGEGGYSNTPEGKACFLRTAEALGLDGKSFSV